MIRIQRIIYIFGNRIVTSLLYTAYFHYLEKRYDKLEDDVPAKEFR